MTSLIGKFVAYDGEEFDVVGESSTEWLLQDSNLMTRWVEKDKCVIIPRKGE